MKKRVKKLERHQDQIIYMLEMVSYERNKPTASGMLPKTLIESAPKLIELSTEVMRVINQKKK